MNYEWLGVALEYAKDIEKNQTFGPFLTKYFQKFQQLNISTLSKDEDYILIVSLRRCNT